MRTANILENYDEVKNAMMRGEDISFEICTEAVSEPVSDKASEQVSEQASRQVSGQVSEQALQIITFCETPKSLSEIMTFSQYKSRGYFVDRVLQPLINQGLIERTFPNIPNHPNQKYKTKK